VKELLERATQAREHAYAPYSKKKVGSAIKLSNGKIYAGCNVENASYGGTVCAERNAIFAAVSENGKIEITEVLVITDESPAWPPCGLCRQVIAEFGQKATIHVTNLKGETHSLPFKQLFPDAFTPQHLK
jgi:cytidine deaminase